MSKTEKTLSTKTKKKSGAVRNANREIWQSIKDFFHSGAIFSGMLWILQITIMAIFVYSITFVAATTVVPIISSPLGSAVGVNYDSHWMDVVALWILPLCFMLCMAFYILVRFFNFLWRKLSQKFDKIRLQRKANLAEKYGLSNH